MATTALIYDAIRTPRGRGRADGALHEVKPIDLLTNLLEQMKQRHDLDTRRVDDLIIGITLGDMLGAVDVPGFHCDHNCRLYLRPVIRIA